MDNSQTHLNILNKKPVNIELYDCAKRDPSLGGEVTSPFILEPSSTRFHPHGLFSEIIFGEMGSNQRFKQFGYIKLNTTILHPMIFVDITRTRKIYKDIMSGQIFVKFDSEIKDFIQCKVDDGGANTGYAFFMNHFHEINWDSFKDKSDVVEDKIKLIRKFPDRLTIDKMLVIPAELREYRIEDGRGTSDEINNLYLSLLNLARTDSDRTNKNTAIYDPLRYKIQLKAIEIFNYIKDILKDDGYLEKKFGSRAIAWSTRNVISPPSTSSEVLGDKNSLKCNETAVPLFQGAKAFQLLVVNKLRTLFFAPIINMESTQVAAINKTTFNLQYISVTDKEKQRYLSDDGIGDMITLFKHKEYRRNHVTIRDENLESYFLYLVYEDNNTIYLSRSKSDMENFYYKKFNKTINLNKLRPLTMVEMLYISTYLASYNKHVLLTRYPVTWLDSMYPSNMKLNTTTPKKIVYLKSLFNDEMNLELDNYPDLKGEFVDSLKVHPSRLAGLDADHDGDQINCTGVISDESNKEISEYMNSLAYYVGQNGKLTTDSGSSYIIDMTLYNMSYMEK